MEFEKYQASKEALFQELIKEARATAWVYGKDPATVETDPKIVEQAMVALETECIIAPCSVLQEG